HKAGFVKNGHGDLRLEHVFIDGGASINELSMIDCIEFNRRFRTNDVLSEIGFLTMEIDQSYKNTVKADELMLGFFDYLKISSEESYAILNFYRCYRAMVRAKVAMITYMNTDDETLKRDKRAEYNTLIDMAFIYSIAMLKIYSIAFCGMIGAGKTTWAVKFSERFRALYSSSDRVRKASVSNEESSYIVPTGEGIYNEERSLEVYKTLGSLTKSSLKAGRISAVDASFLQKKHLESFVSQIGCAPIYIKFTADEQVIRERLASRTGGLSDGRLMHFDDLYPLSKEIPADFEVDTSHCDDPMQAVIDGLIKLLDINVETEL
ncbi:MAG: AAA family ATPase, partial [Deferribacteraceae bacterium]|nr:AAA family ATPase [Deferribacteraceae bacterium]